MEIAWKDNTGYEFGLSPLVKSNDNGIDLDPWGGETGRSSAQDKQPHRFTSYERDGNGGDEAMYRRYDSRLTRFSQPDPFDGSAGLADPQSLNRYAYVQNDPVNFTDPTGLCTFNINISGVSGQELTDMQNEIRRIYATGHHSVVFGLPQLANGGSMNVSFVTSYTGAAANVITSQRLSADDPGITGVTPPASGSAYVNSRNIYQATASAALSVGATASPGTQLGRVGAHETAWHGFFGMWWDNLLTDVGKPPSATELATANIGRFDMGNWLADGLGNLCLSPIEQRPLNINTNLIPLRPTIGGGGRGGGGGRINVAGGYPSWWYSMWDFVNWVHSISLGTVTVRFVDPPQTEIVTVVIREVDGP